MKHATAETCFDSDSSSLVEEGRRYSMTIPRRQLVEAVIPPAPPTPRDMEAEITALAWSVPIDESSLVANEAALDDDDRPASVLLSPSKMPTTRPSAFPTVIPSA